MEQKGNQRKFIGKSFQSSREWLAQQQQEHLHMGVRALLSFCHRPSLEHSENSYLNWTCANFLRSHLRRWRYPVKSSFKLKQTFMSTRVGWFSLCIGTVGVSCFWYRRTKESMTSELALQKDARWQTLPNLETKPSVWCHAIWRRTFIQTLFYVSPLKFRSWMRCIAKLM